MAKMTRIVSTYQKCVRVEKGYLHYDWTYDTNIWMTGGQGGDLHAPKRFFLFLTKLNCWKTAKSVLLSSYLGSTLAFFSSRVTSLFEFQG